MSNKDDYKDFFYSYKITEIREHIGLCVSANDLHPEEVRTFDI